MANRRFIDFPIATTVGDSDIILIWQSGVNKQTTKATFLSGLPENLDELNDVAISGLTNGQILRYDSVTGKWENTDQGNLDLNDLNDVSIVSPSNGQVLVYNSSTSKWENSSGGFVPYVGAVTTVNLGAQTIQAGQFVKAGGTSSQFLKADGSIDSTAYGTGSVTSVGLTMPSAFNVANSPITSAGTLAVTGAGTVAQYIRGDGSLADFPEASGGGSSISYYLNGSVNQGTIGGVAYKELNKVPILGAGTDFTINADGYIASFITDAGDPNLLEIPGGNWNFETYFSASSGGGSPTFYVELYKVSGTTATLIASNSSAPELIAFGTNITAYFSSLAVPTTTLALTDRLAVRYYVTHSGRTITMHTENNHLCQIITTFTTGLTALNGLTAQVQNFATGTTGTDFNIASATATHTFNLPTASATNRGALSSADWTTFNNKQNALGFTPVPSTRTLTINGIGLDLSADRSWSVGDMLLNTYQVVGGVKIFNPSCLIMEGEGTAQPTSLANTQVSIAALTGHNSFGFNSSNNIYFNKGTTANGGIFAFSNSATRTYTLKDASGTLAFTSDIPANPVGGTGTTNYLPKFTGASTIGNSNIINDASGNLGLGVTPSAWAGISGKIFELGFSGGSAAFFQNGADDFWTASNAYFNAGWKYTKNGTATAKLISTGEHYWYNAPSGTAGNAISFTQAMTLKSNGNLLVGTTTDNGARLQVSGTLTASSTTLTASANTYAGGSLKLTSFTGGTNIFLTSVSGLFALSNGGGADHLLIASTGAATFSSNVTAQGGQFLAQPSTGTNSAFAGYLNDGGQFYVGIDNSAGSLFGKGAYAYNFYSNANRPMVFSTDGTTRLTITGSGNVGIGTTSPTDYSSAGFTTLHINGRSGTGGGVLRLTSFDAACGVNFYAQSNTVVFNTTTASPYAWLTQDVTRMTLTSSGNVLIGTTTDGGQRLQVSGTSRFTNNMDIGTSSTNNILMYAAGSNNPSVGVYGGAGSNSANGAASLNVVDFTNNRYWQIQIDGSSQLATFYYNGSVWSKVGYQTTGGTWTNSDERRKENIEISKYGLNEVLQLIPKKFNYKLDERKIKNLGFIAQDVIDLIPESVQTDIDGQKEYYAMNYSNLVPVLVKAIQELNQKFDNLKN